MSKISIEKGEFYPFYTMEENENAERTWTIHPVLLKHYQQVMKDFFIMQDVLRKMRGDEE